MKGNRGGYITHLVKASKYKLAPLVKDLTMVQIVALQHINQIWGEMEKEAMDSG